jgi:hypothetical protein
MRMPHQFESRSRAQGLGVGATCFFQTQGIQLPRPTVSLRNVPLSLLQLFDTRIDTTGYQVMWSGPSCDHRPLPHGARSHSRQPGNKKGGLDQGSIEVDGVESPTPSYPLPLLLVPTPGIPSLPDTEPSVFPLCLTEPPGCRHPRRFGCAYSTRKSRT